MNNGCSGCFLWLIILILLYVGFYVFFGAFWIALFIVFAFAIVIGLIKLIFGGFK